MGNHLFRPTFCRRPDDLAGAGVVVVNVAADFHGDFPILGIADNAIDFAFHHCNNLSLLFKQAQGLRFMYYLPEGWTALNMVSIAFFSSCNSLSWLLSLVLVSTLIEIVIWITRPPPFKSSVWKVWGVIRASPEPGALVGSFPLPLGTPLFYHVFRHMSIDIYQKNIDFFWISTMHINWWWIYE